MNIQPLDDRVLIEPTSKEEQTKSGIVIPDTSDKEKPEQGKVIAVGSGRIDSNGNRIPMTVKVGDVVLFTKYGPNEVKIDNKEYLIAKEEDILAIIK
jgi:chaperonin GroES